MKIIFSTMKILVANSKIAVLYFSILLLSNCKDDLKSESTQHSETRAQITLSKTIIYAQDDMCETVFHFYKDTLGLPVTSVTEDFGWAEFETGVVHLCIHHNNKREEPYEYGGVHAVFELPSDSAVLQMHERILEAGYNEIQIFGKGVKKHLEPGQVSEIFKLNAHKGGQHPSFWMSDPVGNVVQIEPGIKKE